MRTQDLQSDVIFWNPMMKLNSNIICFHLRSLIWNPLCVPMPNLWCHIRPLNSQPSVSLKSHLSMESNYPTRPSTADFMPSPQMTSPLADQGLVNNVYWADSKEIWVNSQNDTIPQYNSTQIPNREFKLQRTAHQNPCRAKWKYSIITWWHLQIE